MTDRTMLAGLIPTAFETLTVNSTAGGLNSTTLAAGGSVLRFSIETNSVRYRIDGTEPTDSSGILLTTGVYEWQGFNGTSALKFIDSTPGSDATINLTRFRHAGDESL